MSWIDRCNLGTVACSSSRVLLQTATTGSPGQHILNACRRGVRQVETVFRATLTAPGWTRRRAWMPAEAAGIELMKFQAVAAGWDRAELAEQTNTPRSTSSDRIRASASAVAGEDRRMVEPEVT